MRFIAPVKLNNFLDSQKNIMFTTKIQGPARAVAKTKIEDNLHIDASFENTYKFIIKVSCYFKIIIKYLLT